jgi:glycosyltransferase involved in cell wall biosynthesis
MPLDILVLAPYLDRQQAGAAQATIAIINALAAESWTRVTVYAWECDRTLLHSSVNVVRGEAPPPTRLGLWRIRPLLEMPAARRDLRKHQLPASFAYTQNSLLGLAFRRTRSDIPIVSHTGAVIASRDIMEEDKELPLLYRRLAANTADRLERASYREPRWCHIVSTRLVAEQRQAVFNLPDDFFTICPYGVDQTRFDPSAVQRDVRAELGIPRSAVLVAAVARLVPWKSIDWVIRAVAQCGDDMHLVVVGDGPSADALRAEAERVAPRRVHFTGHTDPAPCLAASDIFALPSTIESFGMVYAEAMLMRLPCIGRRNQPPHVLSSAQDVIPEGRAGFCVGSEEELLARLRQLAGDASLRRQLGAFGADLARSQYSTRHYVDTLRDIADTKFGLM